MNPNYEEEIRELIEETKVEFLARLLQEISPEEMLIIHLQIYLHFQYKLLAILESCFPQFVFKKETSESELHVELPLMHAKNEFVALGEKHISLVLKKPFMDVLNLMGIETILVIKKYKGDLDAQEE